VRRVLGCDGPLPNGRQHIIKRGSLEPIQMNTCPRKAIQGAGQYFSVYNWAQKGLLEYQYPPDAFPARFAEAIEVIDQELDAKHSALMEANKSGKE